MDESPVTSAGFGISVNDTGWRTVKLTAGGGKRRAVNLRPAPLFRTVGLTGVSASLPPHRRLRSVLHAPRIPSTQTVDRFDALLDRRQRNSPLNGLKCLQEKHLPKIIHANPQKDAKTVGDQHRHHGGRLNATARNREKNTGSGNEKGEYVFEEEWREQGAKTTKRQKNKQDMSSDLSLWIQRLEITDRKREQNTKLQWNDSGGRGRWAEPVCKEAGQTRRDRRPHFLPPITQSDCLLHVPLLLPDNSPPPSPRSPSDISFFPLSVPHIQPFPRGDAAAQQD